MGACFGKNKNAKNKNPNAPQFTQLNQPSTIPGPNYTSQTGSILVPNNKQFIRDALDSHNHYRSMHSAGRLKLNDEMCHIAQAWAERIARTNTFEHSQNMYAGQSLGENIAMRFTSTGDELTGKQMTDQWYEEANNYNYGDDFQQGKGHFAQIVWQRSREVGFGRARANDGKWYAVANYFPAGNYIGQFRENVSPPKLDRL